MFAFYTIQQKPAFQGDKEIKMLVKLTEDLTKKSTGNMTNLHIRIQRLQDDVKISKEDLQKASENLPDWQKTIFNLFIKRP